MEILISRQGELDDDVQPQEVQHAVWKLGQVCIRIHGVTVVEVVVQPTLASEAALMEAQRWVESLSPDKVVLTLDEHDGIKESFFDYADALERLERLD